MLPRPLSFLSIDCASKTFGYSLVQIDLRETELSKLFKVKAFDVVDILSGTKVKANTPVDRARQLHKFLDRLSKQHIDCVFIEKQPPINFKSTEIFDFVVYHFVSRGILVELVDPKLKEKICFSPELSIEKFYESAGNDKRKKYRVRKQHSTQNVQLLFKLLGYESKVRNFDFNNAADTILQMIAKLDSIIASIKPSNAPSRQNVQ